MTVEDSMKLETLSALGDFLVAQADWARASEVYRELLACCVERSGPNHASTLAVRGDLAVVLFEVGEIAEAVEIECEAYKCAKVHLGVTHPVTSVLAWNMVLRHEQAGDSDAARRIVADDLSWLLTYERNIVNEDQRIIQNLLAGRVRWDSAVTC